MSNTQLPAGIKEAIIKAAADLSGRDPGELDALEAIYILQETDEEPQGDLYRQLTKEAAGEIFSDPKHVEEWEEVAAEWDGDAPELFALTLQRDLDPIIKAKAQKLRDDLPADDSRRAELDAILAPPKIPLSPELKAQINELYAIQNSISKSVRGVQDAIGPMIELVNETVRAAIEPSKMIAERLFPIWSDLRESLTDFLENNPAFLLYDEITGELEPFILEELKKPQYEGKGVAELWDEAEEAAGGLFDETNLLMQAVNAARNTRNTIEAQKAGRQLRRQIRETAESKRAIMELKYDGALPVFSEKSLWDAFAPGRISQMGKLAPDAINKKTGRIEKIELEKGDILPLPAANISYKAFMLLNAITANSIDNYRKYLVSGGAIRFYVKGVLDQLEVDARIHGDPQQIELDPDQIELDRHTKSRKTAGALYLEEQLKPLLLFVGTTPDGSRYSVLNYEGYDIESDTMTIRSPYLFQLWKTTQTAFSDRKKRKEGRIAEGKSPRKADLKPLELNTLFKRSAYKEDDTVLEIATYITNVLLNAGRGSHETKIKYKTLINNCPRLRERLEEIERQPQEIDGKKINKTAHYNSTLRKIARAYSLIMNLEKCDALKYFEFKEFSPTKEKSGQRAFIPPTKSTLDGEIYIKWRRIDPDDD